MIIKTFVEGPVEANNYLVIDEVTNEAVLIDCSSARSEFVNAIKQTGVNLKYIFLTHGHFDHVLGIDSFKENFGLDAYICEKDLEQINLVPEMMKLFTGIIDVKISQTKNFVKDGDTFKFGNLEIKAIGTPGHTEGGMSYLIGDKLFSGDTMFRGSLGRTDFPGGNFQKIANSIKEVLFKLPDNVEVYPGHGAKTTIGYEKQYNEIMNI